MQSRRWGVAAGVDGASECFWGCTELSDRERLVEGRAQWEKDHQSGHQGPGHEGQRTLAEEDNKG
eukprot:scaffold11803_cov113-Skeletonema_marinoi.AAC.2